MRIKLITIYASPAGVIQPEQVADLPDAEAKALIAGGFATSVEPIIERAQVVMRQETAVVSAVTRRARKAPHATE
jgi:hypothetical protein